MKVGLGEHLGRFQCERTCGKVLSLDFDDPQEEEG